MLVGSLASSFLNRLVMKKWFLIFLSAVIVVAKCYSQTTSLANYPEPEYINEIHLLKKDSNKLMRLEKGTSKMNTKTKLGGMGGVENGYSIEGSKSTIRFNSGIGLTFIFSTGQSPDKKNSPQADSMLRANGLDPSMMSMGTMMDPSQMITLYKADADKNERKIYLMKMGGAVPFAGAKNKSSDKYTLSIKKIREGYWEMIVDKTLPKGEYAFTVTGSSMASADGSVSIFAFAVD